MFVTENFWSRSGSLFVTENFSSRSDSLCNLYGVIWTILALNTPNLAYLRTLSFVENCSQIVCSEFATNRYLWVQGLILWKIMSPSPVPINPTSKDNDRVQNWKICFSLYVKIQTVNLKTDSKTRDSRDCITCTVCWNFFSPSILMHNKG